MHPIIPDLTPPWALTLGLGIFLYVLLDGFDLGVGLLFGFARDPDSRRLIISSIAPVWDGNETWLVLSSTGLLAAFPLVQIRARRYFYCWGWFSCYRSSRCIRAGPIGSFAARCAATSVTDYCV